MSQDWFARILEKDTRYKRGAYEFLFEALEFTRQRLTKERGSKVKHVAGQELLEGVRLLALRQFGRMAKTVLNDWGIHSTSDFGEMVYALIEAGDMQKTEQDARADFDNAYDFDEAFDRGYEIELEEL